LENSSEKTKKKHGEEGEAQQLLYKKRESRVRIKKLESQTLHGKARDDSVVSTGRRGGNRSPIPNVAVSYHGGKRAEEKKKEIGKPADALNRKVGREPVVLAMEGGGEEFTTWILRTQGVLVTGRSRGKVSVGFDSDEGTPVCSSKGEESFLFFHTQYL